MAEKIISPFDWRALAEQNKKEVKTTYRERNDATLEWKRGQAVSRALEKRRLVEPTYGTVTGLTTKDVPLLPKQFHVYSRAGTANTKVKK